MKTLSRSAILTTILAVVVLAAFVHQASAQTPDPSAPKTPPGPALLGTTGACNNAFQGGPCTQQSTLVQLDDRTGALVQVIGPVGFTVNGMAWDRTTQTLYATTAVGDTTFHGLITINPETGAGTPVNASVFNFGLPVDPRLSPIHSLTVDTHGNLVAWYDEFPPPAGVTDTFVTIDKYTGIATEFPDTGIDTSSNGLSFARHNLLWNIDSPKTDSSGVTTQTAYHLDPADGKPLGTKQLSPPIQAAIGDFDPVGNQYYGLNFVPFDPTHLTFMVVINIKTGVVTTLGQTVDNLHTLAFAKHNITK